MVYQSGFVVCVLTHGKVCHELNGMAELNEGDEYTVRLRNKTDRRAACELFIDGELQGNYVVNAKSFIDVERSVAKNAAFKFTHIDSSESIDQGKNGLTPESGKIVAKFKFEKIEPAYHYQPIYPNPSPYITPYKPWKYPGDYGYYTNISQTFNTSIVKGLSCNAALNASSVGSYGNYSDQVKRSDIGVTVDGGRTNQNFYTTYFPLEYNYAAVKEKISIVDNAVWPANRVKLVFV